MTHATQPYLPHPPVLCCPSHSKGAGRAYLSICSGRLNLALSSQCAHTCCVSLLALMQLPMPFLTSGNHLHVQALSMLCPRLDTVSYELLLIRTPRIIICSMLRVCFARVRCSCGVWCFGFGAHGWYRLRSLCTPFRFSSAERGSFAFFLVCLPLYSTKGLLVFLLDVCELVVSFPC